jgi:ABC-2 type transport system ATP-binding protein
VTRLQVTQVCVQELMQTPHKPSMLDFRHVSKLFGYTPALTNLSLSVERAGCTLLVGANGSGKTTAIRILLGLLAPSTGRAYIAGISSSARGQVRQAVGYVPETISHAYRWLRVRDLIRYHSFYYPDWDRTYQRQLESQLEIRANERLDRLSKGEIRRVQFVLALAHRPSVLILDEPTDGLDPLARRDLLDVLARFRRETDSTLLVCTHVVHEMEHLGDRLAVLSRGNLIADMERDLIRDTIRVVEFSGPADRAGMADLQVLDRLTSASGTEVWIVRDDEERIQRELGQAGASVKDIAPASFDQAAIGLLAAARRDRNRVHAAI